MGLDTVVMAICKKFAKNYTDSAIASLPRGMIYKGNVATYNDLPLTGNQKGYVYTTSDTANEYVWSIDATSGALTDWIEVGRSYSVTIDV